ncbi:MAG: DUF433 domain-containing protein [Candidatus Levybacteria bacterium]|nr:DUF433 domain-containing protein [Candidatus Levybacteria bacterium]
MSDPTIMGGELVIKDTRVPVDVILHRLKDGYSVEEIHSMYSWVDIKTLKGAIGEAIDTLSSNLHA